MGDQFVNLSLLQLWGGMSPVGNLHLLAWAHIEETLVKLLTDFVCREVHILAVLHHVVKWLFLRDEGFNGLRGRPWPWPSMWAFAATTTLLTPRSLLVRTWFIWLLIIDFLHAALKVTNFFHQVLFELFLILGCHLRLIAYLYFLLLVCLGPGWLTHALTRNFLLLFFEILKWLVHMLIWALRGVYLFDEVRKSLYVLACRVLHAFSLLAVSILYYFLAASENLCMIGSKLEGGLLWQVLCLKQDLRLWGVVRVLILRKALDLRQRVLLLGHQVL